MAGLDLSHGELADKLRHLDEPTLRRVAKVAAELGLELRPVDDPSVASGLEVLRGRQPRASVRDKLQRYAEELDRAQWELEEQLDAYGEGPAEEEQAAAYERARAAQTVWAALDNDPVTAALDSLYELTGVIGDEPDVLQRLVETVVSGERDPIGQTLATLRERRANAESADQRERFLGPDGTVPGLDSVAPDLVDALRTADADVLRRTAQEACELALERAPIDDDRIDAAREHLELGPFGDTKARAELRELVEALQTEEEELGGEWDARAYEDRERDPFVPAYRIERGVLVPGGTDEEVALEYARQTAERPALLRTATAHALWQALDEDPLNAAVQSLDSVSAAFLNVDELRELVQRQR